MYSTVFYNSRLFVVPLPTAGRFMVKYFTWPHPAALHRCVFAMCAFQFYPYRHCPVRPVSLCCYVITVFFYSNQLAFFFLMGISLQSRLTLKWGNSLLLSLDFLIGWREKSTLLFLSPRASDWLTITDTDLISLSLSHVLFLSHTFNKQFFCKHQHTSYTNVFMSSLWNCEALPLCESIN